MPSFPPSMKTFRGMTLVEMMVTVALTAMVGGALLYAIRDFYIGNAYVLESATAVDSARRGLATALEDMREASYADDGAYPISSAATSSVTFYADTDKDSSIEKVQIFILNGVLYRVVTNSAGSPPTYAGQSGATTTIVSSVVNGTTPLFSYYDSDGDALPATGTDVSKISSVRATLMIDLNPNRAPDVLTLTGTATLRNLRTQ